MIASEQTILKQHYMKFKEIKDMSLTWIWDKMKKPFNFA